jgi:hypothetical protein
VELDGPVVREDGHRQNQHGGESGGWEVGGANKGKSILIEDNMSRDDLVGEKIEATIPLVIRVIEKKAARGLGCKFVEWWQRC